MRTFIALPLSKSTTDTLGDLAAQLSYQDKSNAIRWLDQRNFHITLAFLGDLYDEELERLVDSLDSHIQQMSFDITLSHLSPFPEARPKLVAAMVTPNDDLLCLHKQVMSAVQASQISIDRKKFKPHITLGRFRHSKASYLAATPKTVELVETVEEVSIFESVLFADGARHEAVFRYPLDNYGDIFEEQLTSAE